VLTRLTNNDPFPLYSSSEPYDFLDRCKRNELLDFCDQCEDSWFRMAFSAFRQSADMGKDRDEQEAQLGDLQGRWNIIGLFYDPDTATKLINTLGLNEAGKPMIDVCTIPNGQGLNLVTDYEAANVVVTNATEGSDAASTPGSAENTEKFGFFSVPIEYRKYGMRFETEMAFFFNTTLRLNWGVSKITQEPRFIDLSCDAKGIECVTRDCTNGNGQPDECMVNVTQDINPICTGSDSTPCCPNAQCCIDWANCGCKRFVIDRIMKQRDLLAASLGKEGQGYDLLPFSKTAFEDMELSLNWSQMYEVNRDSCDWPYFIFTPFVSGAATFPTGSKTDFEHKEGNFAVRNPFSMLKDRLDGKEELNDDCEEVLDKRRAFALPSGNNGHWSYGGRFGFTVDFYDFFAIGAEAGFTGFSKRNHFNYPLPKADPVEASDLQAGLFPVLATVRVQPGFNWHFAATISAYHFLGRWSSWVQYAAVGHNRDKIVCVEHLLEPELVNIEKVERMSTFRFHVINGALNYDIAQSCRLGLVWQIPISQMNAYRSTTWMGTIELFY